MNDTSPILSHQMTTITIGAVPCVEMKRDKSLGGIYKQVSVVLNINIKRWRGFDP